jgi:hypothetical protein
MPWFIMPAQGSCTLASLAALPPPERVQIDRPVGAGPRAVNFRADVRAIQEALDEIDDWYSIPLKDALKIDELVGPLTIGAINDFQQKYFRWKDGLVEPGMNTIRKMNELYRGIPLPDEADRDRKVTDCLPVIKAAVGAAQRNLLAALVGVVGADTANDRLDRHFRLDALSADKRRQAVADLSNQFLRYALVLLTSSALVVAREDFDVDVANVKKALTFPGGFFLPGQTDDTGRRKDHIHLGRGFFAPSVSTDFGAYIILHEMAHFLGHPDGRVIADNGRGWVDSPFITPLNADQRLTNADSYASFATECRTESPLNPGYVKPAPGGLGGAR